MKTKLTLKNHMPEGLAVAMAIIVFSDVAHAASTIWIADSLGRIGTVASDTGVGTVIGNAGVVLTDIAFDPNGNLWGIDTSQLYTVNTGTGVATSVGFFGTGHAYMNGLTFGANGTLYASGTDVIAGQSYNGMFTINTTNGVSTPMSNELGISGFTSAGDLAFDELGDLYLSMTNGTTSALVQVDPLTGIGTMIGQMAPDPNVYGLVRGDDQQLYAVDGTKIYTVNSGTASLTNTSDYGGVTLTAANGAAARKESMSPVPEPATMVLLGLAGLTTLRRRR